MGEKGCVLAMRERPCALTSFGLELLDGRSPLEQQGAADAPNSGLDKRQRTPLSSLPTAVPRWYLA